MVLNALGSGYLDKDLKIPKPKKYRCGPYTWTEMWVPADDPRLEGNDGITDSAKKEVLLSQDLLYDPVEAALTTVHERLHVAWYSMECGVASFESDEAEDTVSKLASGLMQCWRGKMKLRSM